jgi:predicted nucleic acid-binding protein
MIILDTNVLSELIRPKPAEAVVDWVAHRPAVDICITAITQAEILYGVRLLPEGERRKRLKHAVEQMFSVEFTKRILPFDAAAATEYAGVAYERRKLGQPISQFDAQIAAIVKSRKAALATRNESDFAHCGITVINPWAT